MPSNLEEELFQINGNVSKPWWEDSPGVLFTLLQEGS